MNVYGLTDTGAVRKNNQDTFFCCIENEGKQAIFVVCDGMGGANAGNVASDIAANVFKEHVIKHIRPSMSSKYMESILKNAISFANYETYQTALSSREYSGMGTTLEGGFVNEDDLVLVNVGDSRVYLCRKDSIEQITVDHSFVQLLVEQGKITEEEKTDHPRKNMLIRAVGVDKDIEVDYFETVLDGGRLLVCTDGLHGNCSEEELLNTINSYDVEEAAKKLVETALENGGTDNITLAVIENS